MRGVGVLHFLEKKAYALLITLNKSDRDYAIYAAREGIDYTTILLYTVITAKQM